MIIGMDLMTMIGIFVNTRDRTVEWEGHAIPLKERGELQNCEHVNFLYHMVNAPSMILEAEERQLRILDANYDAVDIREYVKEIKHLSNDERSALYQILEHHKKLFSGGLGILNVKPVHLELQPGAKPYHTKPFPIPQSKISNNKKRSQTTHINQGI
jgi:hypothetical protein